MALPIISVQRMRDWERATWEAGQTESTVIVRVGHHIARRALQLTRPGQRILLLAGKGNNGADTRQAEPHLKGREVTLLNIHDPIEGLAQLQKYFEPRPSQGSLEKPLIIDGLFGIGLNRPLDGPWKELIDLINSQSAPVLSVDVPSGLDANTGEMLGASIRATVTLTVGAPKQGLLAPSAVAAVGRLEVAHDVGLVPCPFSTERCWTLAQDFRNFPPEPLVTDHKGTLGHLGIVAGSMGYHGAAVLAAKGAQRARPGLITLFPQEDVYVPVASQLQAVMVRPWQKPLNFERFSGLLFGPGLAALTASDDVVQHLQTLWRSFPGPLVVDASALSWLPQESPPAELVRVITPHPGEAARLLQSNSGEVQKNRAGALRELSRRFGGCWVVLKGHQTLIGRAAGQLFVNSSGGPELGQGGTGDLLAGYLAGWLAQPRIACDAVTAIRYAVWRHGAAADALSRPRPGWIVEELIPELGIPHY